jgi:threonine synthase
MISTPLIKLEDVYLKREDHNFTGSAKDRAISLQVDNLKNLGYKKAVISSTGNAAISASFYCKNNNIELEIFISTKIDQNKLKKISESNNKINLSLKPISDAFKFSKKESAYLLRQSTDPVAQEGYQSIGVELLNQLPKVSSIFIAAGSGTTLLGISKALNKKVKLFAVQSASNCPLARIFDQDFNKEDNLITDAISVKSLPLKDQLLKTIKESGGGAFVIENKYILQSEDILLKNHIITSLEGAMAYAAYLKAIKKGIEIGDNPVIVLTGAKR